VRVIVIGAGEVGANLTRTLAADGHQVTVVDTDPRLCSSAESDLDALVVNGNGASPQLLKEVGAGEADLLAAVTQEDEVNLVAALGARELGAKHTVARVADPDFFGDDESYARDVLGIDFVVDPDRATASDIAEALRLPGAAAVEYFEDGRLGLAEVIVTEDSPLVGVPLADRERVEPAYIVGVTHDGNAHLSSGKDKPSPGDYLVVVAPREHLAAAVGRFAGRSRKVRDLVIFGGGRIGFRLASLLEDTAIQVTMLERSEERARYLAERLRKAVVLHDEGISRESQAAARVDEADAFVACAGDDRNNLLAALNAKRLGVDLCLAVVSREEYVPLVDALGIDSSFSPRLITAEAILKFVHTEALRQIHFMRSGFEAIALGVEPSSPIAGKKIGHTGGLLKGCRVGAILRDEDVVIPRDGTEVLAGDRMLMLSVNGALSDVEPAFSPPK
jgi:trk system potassium uptake protein TrkA